MPDNEVDLTMLKITSRDNPKIKRAKRVRDGAANDLIFVEGLRLAEEVLRTRLQISEIFFTENFARTERGEEFLQLTESNKCFAVSEKIFDSIADTKNSQGVVLICEKPETNRQSIEAKLAADSKIPLVVLLHQINNPANLGAILRTAEAVDVAGIITTKNSADVFSPKSLRGAMGASLRLPLWTNADFDEALNWARAKNLLSVCADINAKTSYLEIDWQTPRLLIFGSEARGLSEEEFAQIDENLLIPMANQVESLNLAVSAGVILFEARRQVKKD